MSKVRIPTPLRKLTAGKEEVAAAGATIINVFANEEDIRFLQGLDTPVQDRDEISIVPAIAGG